MAVANQVEMTKIAPFYGTTSDGAIVWCYGIASINGVDAYRVIYCRLGQAFSGGGTLVGRSIHADGKRAWVRQSGVTRNRKSQNGTMWS